MVTKITFLLLKAIFVNFVLPQQQYVRNNKNISIYYFVHIYKTYMPDQPDKAQVGGLILLTIFRILFFFFF